MHVVCIKSITNPDQRSGYTFLGPRLIPGVTTAGPQGVGGGECATDGQYQH